MSPLHTGLRTHGFFENLAYRVRSGVHKMGRAGPRCTGKNGGNFKGSTGEWALIYKAKQDIQNEAIQTMQLRLDMPDAGGSGGSSDDGNTYRALFSEKNREKFVDLFDRKDGSFTEELRSAIRELIQRFSVILRVVNCHGKVDCEAFEAYCKSTYVLLLETFWDEARNEPWCSVPNSVHRQPLSCN